LDPRRRVARAAARLLYTGAAEEYKKAKELAGRDLGIDSKPSNYEVAVELDILAEEIEGDDRSKLILRLREDALEVMKVLADFNPRLVGSVWRGTARRGSDIDVTVYASIPEEVIGRLGEAGFDIEDVKEVTFTKQGRPKRSIHITVRLVDGEEVEVVVRSQGEGEEVTRCEIFGDAKRGLTLSELESLMGRDPLRKFIPRSRRT
jgi:predicted nucleotidyltransferase